MFYLRHRFVRHLLNPRKTMVPRLSEVKGLTNEIRNIKNAHILVMQWITGISLNCALEAMWYVSWYVLTILITW